MESIKQFVENIIQMCGLSGPAVPIVRHISLVIVVILLAALSFIICRRLLLPLFNKVISRTGAKWNDVAMVSVCRIVPAIVVWMLLPLVFYQFPTVREIVARITAIYITVMATRAMLAFLDIFENFETDNRSATQQYLRSLRGVLRIVIVIVGAVVTIAILVDKSPMSLFAGLGATSAILMFVFKDTLTGLIAGIRLTSNNMVHKGDWITVSKANVNGIVEDISLTVVKVRNFDNTIVTITPQTLVEDSFQNWIGMQQSDGRRVKRLVYYDFRSIRVVDDTIRQQLIARHYFTETELAEISQSQQHSHGQDAPVNLTLYRTYMERYLSERVDVCSDMTLMVRQLEATNTGLPLEFYFFLKQKNWTEYEHHLAEIMEHIYAITPDFGLTIYQQYPEQ
jgi:miniconductance mechanosensitive channel